MVLVYSVIHYIRFLLMNLEFWKTVLSKLEKKIHSTVLSSGKLNLNLSFFLSFLETLNSLKRIRLLTFFSRIVIPWYLKGLENSMTCARSGLMVSGATIMSAPWVWFTNCPMRPDHSFFPAGGEGAVRARGRGDGGEGCEREAGFVEGWG